MYTISFLQKISNSLSSHSKNAPDLPGDGTDLFISYSSRDRPKVLEVARVLKDAGITSWFDRDFIDGGDNYGPAIVDGIKKSRVMALMCSAASMRSRNVRQEIMLGWRYEKPYIPLLLDDYLLSLNGFPEQVAYWLEGNQWIEVLHHPDKEWLPRLTRALQKGGSQPNHPSLISTGHTIRGLLSLSGYTDQFWPTTPGEAEKIRGRTRGAGLRGCRDIAASQDGVGHTFKIGDHVNVVLESAQEGYLTLLDFGTSGRTYAVCPSRFIPDPHIAPGKHVFPSKDSPHPTFVASGRPGREELLAILTDEPLNLDWMPKDPKVPAQVLSMNDLDDLLHKVRQLDENRWSAYATYFIIAGN